MDSKVEFSEIQRFRQWWLMLMLIGGDIIFAGFIVMTVIDKDFDINNSTQFLPLIFGSMAVSFATMLIISMRLATKITEKGIEVRFFSI